MTPSNCKQLNLESQKFALSAHQLFGGFYYGRAFEMHIQMVAAIAKYYLYLIPARHRQIVFDAMCCHALLQENASTYEELAKHITLLGADIVSLATPNNGKTLAQRYNKFFYERVTKNHYAVFVTVCDRIADITFLAKQHPREHRALLDDLIEFKMALYIPRYAPLFEKLDEVAKAHLAKLAATA